MTTSESKQFRLADRLKSKTKIHDLIHEFQKKFQSRGYSVFGQILEVANKIGVPYNHDYCPCIFTPVSEEFLRKIKRLLKKDGSLCLETYGNVAVITTKGDFAKQGYELLEPLSKWAKKKKIVIEVPTDDAWFSSSSIYLIPHEDRHEFMGTTLLCVPQHSGPPAEMFLYPHHAKCLLEALKKVVALAKKKRPKPPWGKHEIKPKF